MPAHEHRRSYETPISGRDRQIVHLLQRWLEPTVTRCVRDSAGGRVLDVGCGEQPLRAMVEAAGGAYVGFDVEQNAQNSVHILGHLDAPLPEPWPDVTQSYEVVLCLPGYGHVLGWPLAFSNLRRLTKEGGILVLTVPFMFPTHMEPIDYFRTTRFALPALARSHNFEVVELQTLGDGVDILVTVLDDLSVLPASRSLIARAATLIVQVLKKAVAAQVRRRYLPLTINSNLYFSNAAVLRATTNQAKEAAG